MEDGKKHIIEASLNQQNYDHKYSKNLKNNGQLISKSYFLLVEVL
jgi:hypothetical protein